MKLINILVGISYDVLRGSVDVDINDISYDSRVRKDNSLFVALVGYNSDGHKYIDKAIENGACAILCERELDIGNDDITIVKVDNTRNVFARVCANFFGNPQNDLTLIGITGTKGKTTTSFIIKKILECDSKRAGLIGTTGTYYNDVMYSNVNTTPESYELFKYMREMVDNDISYVVMEVSSQALKVGRVNNLVFDYGIFTNLTRDHIGSGEHSSMEEYVYCKSLLFKNCKVSILNIDDNYYKNMLDNNSKVYTYGFSNEALLHCGSIEFLHNNEFLGINMEVSGLINDKFKVNMPGKFSAYNAMGAIVLCNILNVSADSIREGLLTFKVRGRMERVFVSNRFSLFIDYAHNGVSMESILLTIREYNPKRVVVVFGCGGNRSRDRRYDMGYISGKYADLSIITSDNSRYESFEDIKNDILKGMSKTDGEYVVIENRKDAIKYSIENACDDDVILILGKGHEDYQEINGVRYPFDERVVIKEIVHELT